VYSVAYFYPVLSCMDATQATFVGNQLMLLLTSTCSYSAIVCSCFVTCNSYRVKKFSSFAVLLLVSQILPVSSTAFMWLFHPTCPRSRIRVAVMTFVRLLRLSSHCRTQSVVTLSTTYVSSHNRIAVRCFQKLLVTICVWDNGIKGIVIDWLIDWLIDRLIDCSLKSGFLCYESNLHDHFITTIYYHPRN